MSYNVFDIPGGVLSGPFRDKNVAWAEMQDILTYPGVSNVRVVKRKELFAHECV